MNNEISLIKLVEKKLKIPKYQRPYEWEKSNVYILLEDILNNYKNNKDINIGTIILYKEKEIVDGQQRLITLSLLLKTLKKDINIPLLDEKIICVSNAEYRIFNNYKTINNYIDILKQTEKININKFSKYIQNNVKFYLLESNDTNEVFQLFSGRNSKYKDLTPVDLLKAYHLGELPEKYPNKEKTKLLKDWNKNINTTFSIDESTNKIEYLFNNVLFIIYNWSLNKNIRKFDKNDIYLYKGYESSNNYQYVKYYKAIDKKTFQINKPFKAGEGFFNMTNHYIDLFDEIIKNYDIRKLASVPDEILKYNFKYINYLYYNSLLLFIDRFGTKINEYQKYTIKDYIYKWSIIHRVKNKQVNMKTINHYVLNTKNNFFFECNKALNIKELLTLEIEKKGNNPEKEEILGEIRGKLWTKLD